MRCVFEALRREKLYANLTKCTFCIDRLVFLGFVVSTSGVEVDEEKVKADGIPSKQANLDDLEESPRLQNIVQV